MLLRKLCKIISKNLRSKLIVIRKEKSWSKFNLTKDSQQKIENILYDDKELEVNETKDEHKNKE